MYIEKQKIYSQQDIESKIKDLASFIDSRYHGKKVVLLGVMNGAFFFMSDLMRRISINFQFDTISCSSYLGGLKSANKVAFFHSNKVDISNKEVIVIEDIIDTGKTIHKIFNQLKKNKPKSLNVVSLFLREKNKINYKILWHGYKLKNEFIVGYGLDYGENYRELKDVYKITKIKDEE